MSELEELAAEYARADKWFSNANAEAGRAAQCLDAARKDLMEAGFAREDAKLKLLAAAARAS